MSHHDQSTILTALAAYDSTFTQLWADRVLVHNDLILASPPTAYLFQEAQIPAHSNTCCQLPVPPPPAPLSRSIPRGVVDKSQHSNFPHADFYRVCRNL
jgi:hypothetical protein